MKKIVGMIISACLSIALFGLAGCMKRNDSLRTDSDSSSVADASQYTVSWSDSIKDYISVTKNDTSFTNGGSVTKGDTIIIKTYLGYEATLSVSGTDRDFADNTLTNVEEDITIDGSVTVKEDIKRFTFTSTATTCTIRALKDKTRTEAEIPSYVTEIGKDAFKSCSFLQSIVIPDGVTSIGESAFYYCTQLASVTIPDGVTSIGESAFY